MNPVIISTAVFMVGAIAAAFCYILNEAPQPQYHGNGNGRRNHDRVYNYNFNNVNTNNYYPSERSGTKENESRNRRQRKKVTMNNNLCGICLEDLTGEIEILSCNHAYHDKCFEKYSQSQSANPAKLSCPLCRASVD